MRTPFSRPVVWFHTAIRVLVLLALILGTIGFASLQNVTASAPIPLFDITDVEKDNTVTIMTTNFPADHTFIVRMGAFGTLGIDGTEVGTTYTGSGGTFSAIYTIPDALKGQDRIAIRLDATSGGYYSYNWFWNTTGSNNVAPTPTITPVSAVPVPTFSITDVVTDDTVTVKTNNFPAGKDFVVRMGAYGTLAIGGIEVGTTNSGAGGVFTATYDIPDSLKGSSRIAIRMDATSGGYYSYNWFWNQPEFDNSGAVYTGIPTFAVTYVIKDSMVAIKTHNFPANKDFVVRMGAYGTLGIGGTVVGTTNSGQGGTFTIAYHIPDSLKGASRIAIRLDATSGGYYSYNWFWNN